MRICERICVDTALSHYAVTSIRHNNFVLLLDNSFPLCLLRFSHYRCGSTPPLHRSFLWKTGRGLLPSIWILPLSISPIEKTDRVHAFCFLMIVPLFMKSEPENVYYHQRGNSVLGRFFMGG